MSGVCEGTRTCYMLYYMLTFGCLKARAGALASVFILKIGLHLCVYSLSTYFKTHKGKKKTNPAILHQIYMIYEREMSLGSKANIGWRGTQRTQYISICPSY